MDVWFANFMAVYPSYEVNSPNIACQISHFVLSTKLCVHLLCSPSIKSPLDNVFWSLYFKHSQAY